MDTLKNNQQKNIALQGAILASASIIVRLIGLFYRVPLTNLLKDEGMGYYSNAFILYQIILVISSLSIPTAVSKLISAEVVLKQYDRVVMIFKSALLYSLFVGSIFSCILWFGAEYYSNLNNMPQAVYAVKTLAPTVLIFAVLGVFRGFFQGMNTMVPTAMSQIIEQIINAIVSVIAAKTLLDMYGGYEHGAAGGTLGTGAGALFGLIFMIVIYFMIKKQLHTLIDKSKQQTKNTLTYRKTIKKLALTILPILIGTAIFQITNFFDNIMLNTGLKHHGYTDVQTAALGGLLDSKYRLFISLPVSIASALAAATVPSITSSLTINNKKDVHKKINIVYRFITIVTIPACMGIIVLARPILILLFNEWSMRPTYMLQIGAISVVFFGLSTVSIAVLQSQSLTYTYLPVLFATISSVIKMVINIIVFFVFDLNLYGMVITNIIFSLCSALLNYRAVKRLTKVRLNINKTFIIPIVASVIMGAISVITYTIIMMITKQNTISTLSSIIVAIMVYIIQIIKLGGLNENELKSLPKGANVVNIFKKIRILN